MDFHTQTCAKLLQNISCDEGNGTSGIMIVVMMLAVMTMVMVIDTGDSR